MVLVSTTAAALQPARVGITVSRKVGSAVIRNRVKRWLREFVRLHPHWLPTSYDVVIIARKTAGQLRSYHDVVADLEPLKGPLCLS